VALYVTTEVKTPQVDGFARISGLPKALALKTVPEGFGFWFVILHTASNSITSETHTNDDDVDGEHWRTSVFVNNSQSFCHQLLKKGEDGAKLE